VLRPRNPGVYRSALRRAYAGAIAVLVVFLAGTVLLDWSRLDATQHIVFSVLIGLAVVIATRLILAFRVARERREGWRASYMNHIYFTYISLWEGFFIVGLFDL
jgi:NADH:ubiquinone oxidoreductase subunit 6 (subunit J)